MSQQDVNLLTKIANLQDVLASLLAQIAANTKHSASRPHVVGGTFVQTITTKFLFQPVSPIALRVHRAIVENLAGPIGNAPQNQVEILGPSAVTSSGGATSQGLILQACGTYAGDGTGGTVELGAVDLNQIYWTTYSTGNRIAVYYELLEVEE